MAMAPEFRDLSLDQYDGLVRRVRASQARPFFHRLIDLCGNFEAPMCWKTVPSVALARFLNRLKDFGI